MRTVTVSLQLTEREARDLEAHADRRGQAVGARWSSSGNSYEVLRFPDETSHWDKLARAIRRAMTTAKETA